MLSKLSRVVGKDIFIGSQETIYKTIVPDFGCFNSLLKQIGHWIKMDTPC